MLAVLALGAGVGAMVGAFVAVADSGDYRHLAISFIFAASACSSAAARRIRAYLVSEFLAGGHPTAAVLAVLFVLGWKLFQATPSASG